MLEWIVKQIICDEYQKKFKDCSVAEKGKGMLLSFSLNGLNCVDLTEDCFYPVLQILLYSESNYTGVYTRTFDVHGLVKKKGEYDVISYHDSCWKTDGVERILYEFSEKIICLSGLSYWYESVEIDEDSKNTLRRIRNEKYGR